MRLIPLAILIVALSACSSTHSATSKATPTLRPGEQGSIVHIPTATPGGKKMPTANPNVTAPVPSSLKTATPSAPAHFPASAYRATVYGTVVNSTSHHPIAGAVVQVADGERTTRTDSSGHYSVSFPTKAVASLQVRKKGYQCGLAMGTLKPGQKVRKDWACTKVSPNHPVPPPFPSFVGTPGPGMQVPGAPKTPPTAGTGAQIPMPRGTPKSS
jgi:hypothetical protein